MTSELWKELHSHALNDYVDSKSELNWLFLWTRKIPRFTTGCKCKENWDKWYKANPPDFTTKESYFAWTVKAHNDINNRLGKPIVSVEDAKKLYRR